jgi:hypothetical protein
LELGDNLISGTFPLFLTSLTNIYTLTIGSELTGTIPTEMGLFWRKLRVIHMDNNKFTGTLPSEFGRFKTLLTLSLNDNNLTGTIPSEFLQLTSDPC